MIKIENQKMIVELPKMDNRQQLFFKNLSLSEKLTYIETFNGKRKHIYPNRFKRTGPDKLAGRQVGHYARMMNSLCDGNKTFNPKQSDFHFGVEIECFIPKNEGDESCDYCNEEGDSEECSCGYETDNQIRNRFLKHLTTRKIKNVSIKYDGSIQCSRSNWAVEFTVLVNTKDWSNLKKLCELLAENNAKVNKTCGLHVHLDARTLDKKTLRQKARNFGKSLGVLKLMVPESRRINTYCQMGVSKLNGTRYYAVNLTSYSKYKTLEVRLHSGTTNFEKIYNWCTILKSIYDAPVKTFPKIVVDVNDLSGIVNENNLEYMQQRIDYFNGNLTMSQYSDNDLATAA